MGVVVATDIFQAKLGDLLGDLPHVVLFLDDILVVSAGSFDNHLAHVEKLLQQLLEAGMQENQLKSFWFQGEVEYQGFVINRQGVKPLQKEIEK